MGNLVRPRSLAGEAAALRADDSAVPVAVARMCDRIDEVDPALRAFVPEPGRRRRLTVDAAAIAQRWPRSGTRPALYGVPVGVKDIVRVDELPTRAGSSLPPEALDGPQALLVDRLLQAGALVAGKTVTAEFAATAPGATRNPHHLEHTPGGSSSGSAAAVAAGLVPLAIGTQTIGSVIRPAAYCGVVGFKPSYGRIPVDGVIAHSPTFDTIGLFAADVASAVLAAAVLCDRWSVAPAARRPVLGIPVGAYLHRAGVLARGAFAQQVARLDAAGLAVREIPVMADFEEIARNLFVVNRYELAHAHANWFPRFGALYREQTAVAIREGQDIDAQMYARALRARERFREELLRLMSDSDIDLWITPSATGSAPRGLDSTGDPVMCLPWSNAGLPSVTVPAGRASDGLPLGLQCVGPPASDELLLDWAATIEATLAVSPPSGNPGP